MLSVLNVQRIAGSRLD